MKGEKLSYPNLEAEMVRRGITGKEAAECLGIARSTFSGWMNGASASFPVMKAKEMRDRFFPQYSLDYLFDEMPDEPAPPEASLTNHYGEQTK